MIMLAKGECRVVNYMVGMQILFGVAYLCGRGISGTNKLLARNAQYVDS